MYWISGYLSDVEVDFWRFYRIEIDIEAGNYGGLHAARFFEMAERLLAYRGALTARFQDEQEQKEKQKVPVPAGATVIGSSKAEIMSTPAMAELFEFG